MPKKIFVVILLLYLFNPRSSFARDPYPNKLRMHWLFINAAANADPATLKTTDPDHPRSDAISFGCYFNRCPNAEGDCTKYLNTADIDTLSKATNACNSQWPDYTSITLPFAENNKETPECNGKKYDVNCYDWPFGMFKGTHPNASHEDGGWVTPLVYGSSGQLNYQGCNGSQGGLCAGCFFTPRGPDPWVRIWRFTDPYGNPVDHECFAPPYATGGTWWNWFIDQVIALKNSKDFSPAVNVGIFLGIDGEGRPLKSGDNWSAPSGFVSNFYNNYVPRVVQEIKNRYPGKTIRGHADEEQKDIYLNNDVDFHRESLASDELMAYLYRGFYPYGWWQMYTNFWYITNTLGLGQGWPPMYQTILSALSKHTDGITGIPFDGSVDAEFLKFAGKYIGRNINDTPGVWTYLRDTRHLKDTTEYTNYSGKYGDYDYYLYRPEDLIDNKTKPVGADEIKGFAPLTSSQIYSTDRAGNQFVGRKNDTGNNYMSFDIDDGYKYVNRTDVSFDIIIVYLDVGSETIKFQYKDQNNNLQVHLIQKLDSKKWQEKSFTLNSAFFNNNMSTGTNADKYPTDFRLETNGSIIHFIEVKGKENISEGQRPKAQVSCDLVRQETDDPKEGITSIGLNQTILIKAKLTDNQGNPLPNQRVMFTYNTEWNMAKSKKTGPNGIAFSELNTTNRVDSSGFLGDYGATKSKPSFYSVQVYFPGNREYQPSRNDCLMLATYSPNPSETGSTRLKIINVDESTNPPKITYAVFYGANMSATNPGTALLTKTVTLEKKDGFYPNDPNAQTINLYWSGEGDGGNGWHHASTNNITLYAPPFTPSVSLKTGWNTIKLPHPNYLINSSNLPRNCSKLKKINEQTNNYISFFKPGFSLMENNKYFIYCSQTTNW